MKNLIVSILSLISFAVVSGQNVDSLRILSFEKTHPNLNFQKLVQKYNKLIQPIDSIEFEYLYYLKFKNPDFTYFDLTSEEKFFRERYNSRKYQESAELGIKLLQKDPTDLKTLLYTSISFKNLNQPDSAAELLKRFDLLLNIISKYGDGKTIETSYQVVKISDEHAILEYSKDMFYNRITKQESDCIIDSWDIFSAREKKNYNLNFKFNNLYTYPKK
ncbi:MAG: DUF4919 domain-containing protein [Bacteroidales bacterium]|nr:DUF4919 domain-containing protein [Bacteroidales bacterium]